MLGLSPYISMVHMIQLMVQSQCMPTNYDQFIHISIVFIYCYILVPLCPMTSVALWMPKEWALCLLPWHFPQISSRAEMLQRVAQEIYKLGLVSYGSLKMDTLLVSIVVRTSP